MDLGAEYPADLERDKFAFLAFRLYNLLIYGKWIRRNYTKIDKNGEGMDYATGNEYGSVYNGPGVNPDEERRIWKQEVEAERSLRVEDFESGSERTV